MNIINNIQSQFDNLFNKQSTQPPSTTEEIEINVESNFKLPIEYLDKNDIKTLSPIVSNDLELMTSIEQDSKTMYEHLLSPEDTFSKQMIENWNKYFTNNIHFLRDTQHVIKNMDIYKHTSELEEYTNTHCILKIWKNTKETKSFLEKYNYMEWDSLKFLNNDSFFLQILFCIHMASPVIQFCIPLLLLIFPFIILKVSGTPISVSVYVSTLKKLASNHSIGKILFNIGTLEWDKIVYLLFTVGMYFFQIYQNIIVCKRFYKNIISINDDLYNLKQYTSYSIKSMNKFLEITNGLENYKEFNENVAFHSKVLNALEIELGPINKFNLSFNKLTSIGYLLKMYHTVHINKEYENSIIYSMGFEGFKSNLCKIHGFIEQGSLSFATFDRKGACKFDGIYYPAITHINPVRNNISMTKNKIISAPNKAGKTTIIKTMMMNVIFTQQFGCGFYKSANINPYSHIHSYLNIPDTSGRDSLFQAESRRCKEIINIINDYEDERHFCIFDELYSGTNPEEAVQAGNAFIKYIEQFTNVDFILTTHYKNICNTFKKSKRVENYKMKVVVNEDKSFNYFYKLVKGISDIKGGIRVLKDMDYPEEIINNIE